MTATQLTLVQIDDYGPWTTTPAPRPEPDLQALQSRLFADVAQFVGSRDGYAFHARFDNVVAVTNGLDLDDHATLQASVGNRYPVTVSCAVAADGSPVAALGEATAALQAAGSAQDPDRRAVLRGDTLPADARTGDDVRIAHFDVVDVTGRYTDRCNAADALAVVHRTYGELLAHMREVNDALSFYVGGDNVVAVCPDLDRERYAEAVDHVEAAADVELQVGVGEGPTARAAGAAAKHALEDCRRNGSRVECTAAEAAGD